jgi:beta-glucosidase
MSRTSIAAVCALALSACVTSDSTSVDATPSTSRCAPTGERPWLDSTATPECRAEAVLATLPTTEEQLAFLEGGGFGTPPAFAERGLVTGRTQDGPAGFNGGTAWPTPLTIAASFDPALAARYGRALGREFHESGRNGILGPAFDTTRTWHFGRSTESFGEDPYLAARLAAREVAAIQAEHVLVTAKHYAVYTQEQGRLGDNPIGERPAVNQIVSERALREIYLPAFEAAVVEGRAGGVMCSFPRINGTYACEHEELLSRILKGEWGFDGAVAPDFPVAQRSIVRAFRAGLDAGTMSPVVAPGTSASTGRFAGEPSLREAVAQGLIPASRVADLVRRRLVPGFRVGTFDHPATAVREDPSTPEARALAVAIVEAGAVLLKNDGALPLSPSAKRIAVIGPDSGPDAVVTEQGSPYVEPRHLVTAVDGLRARAPGGTTIVHAPGGPSLKALAALPSGLLTAPDRAPGLLAEYYASPDIALPGTPFVTRVETELDLNGVPKIDGLPADKGWAVRWRARFTARASGVHRFTLEGSGSAQLLVDGKLVDAFASSDFGSLLYAEIELAAGASVPIEVRYSPRATLGDAERNQFATILGTVLRLGYAPPDDRRAQAVAAARDADVAVVLVGHTVGEGWDRRSLELPSDQDELIGAVAAANPHTVVVLVTGGPVAMPWLDRVPAVLQLWLPGDAFGTALARLLYGDADPGGRLPVTFPVDETQGPGAVRATYPGTLTANGALDTVNFNEDLAIGYRYYDRHDQRPLFPFGYGLSYAQFAIRAASARALADGGAEVRVRVANTSTRAGTDVLQVYVGFPAAAGEPPRQLKGMMKLDLAAGVSREAVIPLTARAFQIWDAAADRWVTPPGAFTVAVGHSSRDLAMTTELTPRSP